MPIDNVQLKREDVVGSEVVLEDINPKTSTNSVASTATGDSLDVVLDRIWNAINARLSRVVNSVNGRTGVVVLDASDIGLGKVDNVSFGDIKTWVINMMRSEFKDKNMKLVNDLTELNALISTNNKSYASSPFFSTAGYAGDKRSYIGYIYYDEGTKKLEYKSLPINTVGFTDNSLIYNENVNGVDTRGGGLAVNIHKDEDALQLKNPDAIDKSESGLMIDKSKVIPRVYMCNGLYYDQSLEPRGLLSFGDGDSTTLIIDNGEMILDDDGVKPRVFQTYGTNYRYGDILVCSFDNEYRLNETDVRDGIYGRIYLRQPCIGFISDNGEGSLARFVIHLHTIQPRVNEFLSYNDNGNVKVNIEPDGGLYDSGDNQMAVKLLPRGLLSIRDDYPVYTTRERGIGINVGLGVRADTFECTGIETTPDTTLSVSVCDPLTGWATTERHIESVNYNLRKFYGGLRYVRDSGHHGYGDIAIRINDEDDWDLGYMPSKMNLHKGTRGLCIDEYTNVLGVQLEPARNDLQIDPFGKLIISDTYMPSLHPLELISNGCGPVYFKGQQPLTLQVNSGLKMTENMKDLDYSIGIKIAEGSKLKIDENGCLDIDLNIAEGSCLKIDDNGCLDIDYAKLAEKLKEYNTDSETPGSGSDSTETPDDTGSGEDDGTTTDPDNPNPDSGTTTPEAPDDTGGDNTGDDSGNTGDDTNPDSGTDTGDTGGSSDYVPEEGEYGDPNNPDTGEETETTTPEETTNSGET